MDRPPSKDQSPNPPPPGGQGPSSEIGVQQTVGMPSIDAAVTSKNPSQYAATVIGLRAGQKLFNRFTLIKKLGQGGMGVVWQAQDATLEQDVALKFLPEAMRCDGIATDNLKRETRRALKLTHTHIVRVYDFIEDGQMAAISMEYVQGSSLMECQRQKPERHFEPDEIIEWIKQICEALDYAHTESQVIHRDLKPGNILIDERGRVRIADFGIARSLADSRSRISMDSSGTPSYMSPQQARGKPPSPLDDVYALGATIYDLLTTRPPFYTGEVIFQVMHETAPSMAERRKELKLSGQPLPAVWEEVVAECLAKDGNKRPQSAKAIYQRLSGHSQDKPKVAEPANDKQAVPVTPPKTSGKSALWPALAAVLILAALGAWYFLKPAPSRQTTESTKPTTNNTAQTSVPSTTVATQTTSISTGGLIVAPPAGAIITLAETNGQKTPAHFKNLNPNTNTLSHNRPPAPSNQAGPVLGSLEVTSDPTGAEVALDGKSIGISPVSTNLPIGSHELRLHYPGLNDQIQTVIVSKDDTQKVAIPFPYGSVFLTSEPSGATVKAEGLTLGLTPLLMERVTPGEFKYQLELDKYLSKEIQGTVLVKQETRLSIALINAKPQSGKWWTNSLEMAFAPVAGTKALFSVWETRIKDFQEFSTSTNFPNRAQNPMKITLIKAQEKNEWDWQNPGFKQGPQHPVVGVTWQYARVFCDWLTEKEKANKLISGRQRYRLPTDHEWSTATGVLKEEARALPKDKDGRATVFGWGVWPPAGNVGNFAGQELQGNRLFPAIRNLLQGYNDGNDFTATVGSYRPNQFGIYDMDGNVSEWCEDAFGHSSNEKVARGSSWRDGDKKPLMASFRLFQEQASRSDFIGFRVVLDPEE